MSKKNRTQILLEPEQHAVLVEVAQRQNRSISDLVRQIVDEWLSRQHREARLRHDLQILEELGELRRQIQEAHGVYSMDLIDAARGEREEGADWVWRGDS